MPLVTRQSNQGNLFKEDTTPNWTDGDLWSDTLNDVLKLNVGGTATVIKGLNTLIGKFPGDGTGTTVTTGTLSEQFDNYSLVMVGRGGGNTIYEIQLNDDTGNNYSISVVVGGTRTTNGAISGILTAASNSTADQYYYAHILDGDTSEFAKLTGIGISGATTDVTWNGSYNVNGRITSIQMNSRAGTNLTADDFMVVVGWNNT